MKAKQDLGQVSLLPWLKDLLGYRSSYLKGDLRAAITVALIALPQSISYSLIADLPPSVGIFSVIFGVLFTGLWSSSTHLIAGSTNAIAMIIQTAVAEILYIHFRGIDETTREIMALNLTLQLSFIAGVMQVVASLLKLGRLTQYVSRTVIIGYITGVAIAVVVNQGYYFFGISMSDKPQGLYQKFWDLVFHLKNIHWQTVALGGGGLCVLLILKRWKPHLPGGLFMLIIGGFLVWFLGWSPKYEPLFFLQEGENIAFKVALVRDTGALPGLLPSFFVPLINWEVINDMLPFAFALCIISVMEAHAISKTVAGYSGQSIKVNQNIFALGIGNVVSSFFGAMPSSGSPSRTMLNFQVGARTRFASLFCAVFIAVIVGVFGSFVGKIPLACLAALLFYTAYQMLQWKALKVCVSATFEDAFVLIVTILSCVFFSLDTAFYIGVIIAIIFYLKKSAEPYFVEYVIDEEKRIQMLPSDSIGSSSPVRIVGIEGEFFFGSVEVFHTTLKEVADKAEVEVIILNLHTARHLDATACLVLNTLYTLLQKKGCFLMFANISKPAWKVMRRSGLISLIGKDNFFQLDDRLPNLALRKAVHRAQQLIEKVEE